MPASIETVQDFIAAFIKAWPTADPAPLGSFFDEDAVYHNIPLEPVIGRSAIVATIAQFMSMGGQVDVDIIHIVAEDPIVMTERVDHFTRDDGTTISLPVMGVIEVHGGLIAAWRDYFDLSQFTSQTLGEADRTAVPWVPRSSPVRCRDGVWLVTASDRQARPCRLGRPARPLVNQKARRRSWVGGWLGD
jgi:limonene-1,2-epoxide hydrolase